MQRELAAIAAIAEAMEQAIAVCAKHNLESFSKDPIHTMAVYGNFVIIGEASKRIDETTRSRYPAIPWRKMAGLRDKIVHEYHVIDWSIIWVAATRELPTVLPQLRQILADQAPKG